MFGTFKKLLSVAVAVAVFALPSAKGVEQALNLTQDNSQATVGGVIFGTTDTQPTGTGVIQSFVRIGDPKDLVQGYNTDNGTPLNDKGGPWTHSVLLSSLMPTLVSGVPYYQFLLDINQTGSNVNYNLNEVQFWVSGSANLNNYSSNFSSTNTDGTTNTGFVAGATKVYDLDSASNGTITNVVGGGSPTTYAAGDVNLLLNYTLDNGSGSGDMFAFVPTSIFSAYAANASSTYVYLFSAFGNPNANNDGFEEWAAKTGSGSIPFGAPEPSPISLALAGLGTLGLVSLRRRRNRPVGA